LFAAGMPICGGGDCNVIAERLAGMPLRFFHGGVDSVVPAENSRSIAEALSRAGAVNFLYTEIPGCNHNSWTQTYRDFTNFDWLFAQKRT
ncbi:MAG: phospholipase, partial [Lentisphaeria bacterium]|nr:phospholipase [Lentisphaeria bacterium]